jgi:phosphoglycolate phosphatase-like HAD superfamily hydrolase
MAGGIRAILFDFDGVPTDVPFFPDAAHLPHRLPPGLHLAIVSGSRRPEVAAVLAHKESAENVPHEADGISSSANASPAATPLSKNNLIGEIPETA